MEPAAAAILILLWSSGAFAEQTGWQRQQVDWHMTGGSRIKTVCYPGEKPLPMAAGRKFSRHIVRKKFLPPEAAMRLKRTGRQLTEPVVASVVESPPVNGFVPWIATAITDARSDVGEVDAVTQDSVVGNYLTVTPQADYAIGVLDTGASTHVMGNADATLTGLFDSGLITTNTTTIAGVTGSVDVWVSQPLGVFVDGLGAIEPNGLLLDNSGMVGQSNVSIAVGQTPLPDAPDLPTTVGSPLSVYFAAAFRNDYQITIIRDSNQYTAPQITFYDLDEPCVPSYANIIPLELRPLGGVSVQYVPDFENLDFDPISPSTIVNQLLPSQSIFFVSSVDLYKGSYSAIDKDRFLFDTGAQITVVGSRVGARLGFNPAEPDFEVEIQGVNGETVTAPGFYISSLDIPALGEWLSFTNIPVILLDIASPEGGTVDGVIGMNLFVDLNFVFRGGGLFLQPDPSVEYEPIDYRTIADIDGDGVVDFPDLATFAEAWLATPTSPNWNPKCDLAPPIRDGKIDFADFAVLAEYWRENNTP
jgi:hypothetical protein